MAGFHYRLTDAGRAAWEEQDIAVPTEYRRLLWMMDVQREGVVADKLTALYPPDMLEEWLRELEDIGCSERIAESETGAAPIAADGTVGVDPATMAAARIAGASLARTGAYLALERLRYRPRVEKSPADTVILIVEDDPDQLALADLRVSMAGYRVRVADSANAFLHTMFDDGAPDLLVLDLELPDGDGFEILARMRRHRALSGLPIVLLTARDEPEMIGKGLVLGADAYVTKPYTKRLLADIIAKVLRQG